jgi:Domain of unknown function (DUF5069)
VFRITRASAFDKSGGPFLRFNDSTFQRLRAKAQASAKVVWPFRSKWTVDQVTARSEDCAEMQTKTPCTDYIETKGLIYFARMLDKIRLKAAGKLPPDYFTGVEDPTHFDARCTRFLGVKYDELADRTLKGGSDDEILEWCFTHGRRPSDEEISVWNAFIRKRGWRDDASEELAESKREAGFGDRQDIQTWMDLHDAEEGRKPAFS